jgi:hypothetical protein
MDQTRFDALARSLSGDTTRRGLGRLLGGLSLGAILASPRGPDETAAKKKPCPPCKKRKKGKCKANQPDETACENGGVCRGGSCVPPAESVVSPPPPPPPPPPPEPTCTDGTQNGSETGIDCGGTCPRCGAGQGCANGNDCEGGWCSNGACAACTTELSACGTGCFCRKVPPSGPLVCVSTTSPTATSCPTCPAGTVNCFSNPFGGVVCERRCPN